MIDNPFRKILEKHSTGLIDILVKTKISANLLTCFSFLGAMISAYFVIEKEFIAAILIWWLSRLLDGLDGLVARKSNTASPFGAFLDINLDMASYALIILALAKIFPQYSLEWNLILLLYILCITSALASGEILAKVQKENLDNRGINLLPGLAEAGETGIAYTLFLLFPEQLLILTWIWIAVLLQTVVARFVFCARHGKA